MRSMTERGREEERKRGKERRKRLPKTNAQLLQNARNLRKSMTPQEKKLWYDFLRQHPLHWYKQKVFGNYILDFYCPKAKLAIEVDGSQHYTADGLKYDEHRTYFLKENGICVLRFMNSDIDNHFEAVCRKIDDWIMGTPLSQLR